MSVTSAAPIHLTDAAAAFLHGVVTGRGHQPGEVCLLVSAQAAGGRIACSMRLAHAPHEALRFQVHGIEVAVAADSLPLLRGAEIGFIGGRLSIANPNEAEAAAEERSA